MSQEAEKKSQILERSTKFRSSNPQNPYPPTAAHGEIRILFVEGRANFVFLFLLFPFLTISWIMLGCVLVFMYYLKRKKIPLWQVGRLLRTHFGERVCYPNQEEYERSKGIVRKWPF